MIKMADRIMLLTVVVGLSAIAHRYVGSTVSEQHLFTIKTHCLSFLRQNNNNSHVPLTGDMIKNTEQLSTHRFRNKNEKELNEKKNMHTISSSLTSFTTHTLSSSLTSFTTHTLSSSLFSFTTHTLSSSLFSFTTHTLSSSLFSFTTHTLSSSLFSFTTNTHSS